MPKLPHQSTVPPVDGTDAATKADGGAAESLQTTGASVDVAAAAPPTTGQVLKATGATTATWQNEAGGGAADALSTTGADVDVSTAPPPTTGQALVATSATTATWQDVAASGPVAAAGGDYIVVVLSGDQDLGVSASDATLAWDTVRTQRGVIALASNQVSLKAGRTYWLQAAMRLQHSSAASRSFYFYDVTGAAAIGTSSSVVRTVNETASLSSQPVLSFPFTPTVDSLVEVRAGSGTDNVDADSQASWFQVTEIGAVQAEVVGGLEFVDIIEVTGAAVQDVDFGTGGDGVLGRALDGDVDQTYFIEFILPATGLTPDITLQPNSASTLQASGRHAAGASHVIQTSSDLRIAGLTANRYAHGTVEFYAETTGEVRGYQVRSIIDDADPPTTTDLHIDDFGGFWGDKTTNVTSLRIHSSVASGIAVGARFILWRRTRNNLKTANASIYERNVQAVVAQGTNSATTYTTGHATFGGSAVGVSASLIDDTVSSGSITVEFKVAGSTILTVTLDSTNTSYHRAASPVGVIPVAFSDAIEVDISTTSLVTAGAGTPGIMVNVMMTNDAFIKAPTGPDYMIATLSSAQTTNVNVNNHIEWDSSSSRGTAIALSAGAGQAAGIFTLQPGKTYEIHAHLGATTNEGSSQSRWTLHPADTPLIDDTGEEAEIHVHVDNVGHDLNGNSSSIHVFTPSVETQIKIDITSDVNFVSWTQFSRVYIKELK